VAGRQGWEPGDTVAVRDLATTRGVSYSSALYGAEHGGGVARDASGRLFTSARAFAAGPREALARVLADRPDLAALDPAHWVLQATALASLPGVKTVTLQRHAPTVPVLGAGGRKARVWVHLAPEVQTRLRRVALDDVIADWNRAYGARGTGDAGAPASRAAAPPAPPGPLTAALCVPRAALLAALQARGVGVAYQTYQKAVRAGRVLEVFAVPDDGGVQCAHAVVPRAVQITTNRAVVLAWLGGAYANPSTWTAAESSTGDGP
jgi:hypothetical protein